MLTAAENHAEAGDGGRELEILAGRVELAAALLERELDQPALDAIRLLVTELEREQLAAGGCVGQSLGLAGFRRRGRTSDDAGLLILEGLNIRPRLLALIIGIDGNQ